MGDESGFAIKGLGHGALFAGMGGVGRGRDEALIKEFDPSRARGTSVPDGGEKQRVEAAANQFEALLVHQMMNSMWATTSTKDSLLGSKEEDTYRDMFSQALSDEISKGQGIGIKGVIAKELTKTPSK